MRDPLEGVSATGTITTGASRSRVPTEFEPVLDEAVSAVHEHDAHATLYVYGSVATGRAVAGRSDVDLLTIDLDTDRAADVAARLTARFDELCRSVDVAAAIGADFVGDTDEAYGGRVFLRHYCVRLTGPGHDRSIDDFPADARAVRGFNGDIADHAGRWRRAIAAGEDHADVGLRMARKSLLAVAGLVSVHDAIWTTDRTLAATRWGQIEPDVASGLARLHAWCVGAATPDADRVLDMLDTTVDAIVERFAERIGLWDSG